jgi:chromosome segregation ATPase
MISFFQNRNLFGISSRFAWGGLLFLTLGLFVASSFAAETKTDPLPLKMEQLLELRQKASTKLASAFQLLDQINRRMDELWKEILEIRQHEKIISYAEAARSARIKYNLLLLAQLQAYASGLDREIEKLKEAEARLDFMYQMTEDDLKINETLDHMESAALPKQIDQTIGAYQWLNGNHLLAAKGMKLPATQKIWQNFNTKKANGQKGR